MKEAHVYERQAQECLESADALARQGGNLAEVAVIVARAQVYATLAVAATRVYGK